MLPTVVVGDSMKRYVLALVCGAWAWGLATPASALMVDLTGPSSGLVNQPITFQFAFELTPPVAAPTLWATSISVAWGDHDPVQPYGIALQQTPLTGTAALVHTFSQPGTYSIYTSLFEFWVVPNAPIFTGYASDFLQITIAAAPTPAATPIPAALPLFVSALFGLGFVGWRRKRA
jgi:hypothetical protein